MAFSFIAASSSDGTGVTNLQYSVPAGTQAGDLLVGLWAFEGVAAGSGPWIIPNVGQLQPNGIGPAGAWYQYAFQAPGAAGVGIEVWCAIDSSASNPEAFFTAAQNVSSVMCTYRGEYNPTGNILGAPPRLATSQQVSGNQPPSPSVSVNVGELIIAVAGDTMTGAGFGTPSGFSNRVDHARVGAGNVEATIADRTATVAGPTGPITFPNNASGAAAKGATATLVFSLAPSVAGAGPVFDAPLPPDLDLANGWTLRVTALDPVTGAVIPGVNVSNFAAEVVDVNESGSGLVDGGEFLLVPGPGA
jgi:hypothetical protein